MFDKQTKVAVFADRLWIIHTSCGRETALICQASGINASQIPSVDRNVHPVRTQTCSVEGPSLLLHTEQIYDLHGQRASPQVLSVCEIQGGHPIVMNVNNNDVATVQYGSLLLHKQQQCRFSSVFGTCVVVIKAAVTRMSAHHDSATFLVAAHMLPVPVQQAAVDGTCVLTLFTPGHVWLCP